MLFLNKIYIMIVQEKQEAKGTVSTASCQEEQILNLPGSEQGPTEPLLPCKESIPDLSSREESSSMRGGADPNIQDLEEQLMIAIQGGETPLMLDRPTLGDGNCWSRATVQQCQRAPIKLYLQSRGLTITNFMQLKALIYQFVKTNSQTGKIMDMKTNFDLKQLNMHEEDLPSRSWAEYWADMQTSGPWADDTFIQATAWFLRVDLRIIYVEPDDMTLRGITTIAGDFEPSAQEERPVLYYAYLVNYHYQSLLPVDETPANLQCLAQPAIDATLKATLEALKQQKLGQEEQVRLFLKKIFYFYTQGHPPAQQASSFRGDSNICDSLFPMR